MRKFQKLESPQLVELEGEYGFVIVGEIDVSEMKNGIIFMRGKSYNYEDETLTYQRVKEVQYSIKEDAYFEIDDKGNIID